MWLQGQFWKSKKFLLKQELIYERVNVWKVCNNIEIHLKNVYFIILVV